jgi:Flp pilus assembly protein TadG
MKSQDAGFKTNRADRGTAVVEAALTLVLFLTFIFAIMEIGRFMQTQELLTNAAREGARLAVTPLPGTSTLPTTAEIEDQVEFFLESANLAGATVTATNEVVTYGTVDTEFTRVRAELPYNLVTGLTWFQALEVTLAGESVMRDETSP